MIKYKYILIFISVFSLSTYAQNANNDKGVQQEWRGTHFSSDKSLMGNIKEVKEIEQILTVFAKGNLEELCVAEENHTIFITLDSALEKMKRRERKAFLENTDRKSVV